uniref:PCNA-interacting partner n=1 Tax=Terrapene triunguis TaxID=2587831 RepID=A0A674IU77_9SAUR
MATFQQKILNMIKCFRRQWCLFSNSERTTVCGADCMMMVLQLSMAEVNKQVMLPYLTFRCLENHWDSHSLSLVPLYNECGEIEATQNGIHKSQDARWLIA